jgi:hypothetical protein
MTFNPGATLRCAENVKERLYTEELESQENVQKYFTMGFYNRTGLLTYIPNANFDSTKFEASWTNVTMQMEMVCWRAAALPSLSCALFALSASHLLLSTPFIVSKPVSAPLRLAYWISGG